jgi:hypothetical protein
MIHLNSLIFWAIIGVIIIVVIACIVISVYLYKEYKRMYFRDKVWPYLEKISTEKPSLKSLEILDKMLIKAVRYGNIPKEKYVKIVNIMNGYFMNNKEVAKNEDNFTKAYNSFLDSIKDVLKGGLNV